MQEENTTGAESGATPEPTAQKADVKKTPRPKKAAAAKSAPKAKAAKKAAPKKAAPKAKAAKKAAPKKAAPKKAAPKAKKESTGQRGRTSQFAGMKLYKLVSKNPRREGTQGHTSFSLITNGMKYEKYIELGGRSGDLKFDVAHKYVQVKKD